LLEEHFEEAIDYANARRDLVGFIGVVNGLLEMFLKQGDVREVQQGPCFEEWLAPEVMISMTM
jgi:hypothetical protein